LVQWLADNGLTSTAGMDSIQQVLLSDVTGLSLYLMEEECSVPAVNYSSGTSTLTNTKWGSSTN